MMRWSVEVGEFEAVSGERVTCERYVGFCELSAFVHSPTVREACGSCPRSGKNLGCPPFSPHFTEFVGSATSALVVMFRGPVSALEGESAEEAMRTSGHLLQSVLRRELLEWREAGFVVAGAGACKGCPKCAAEAGATECPYPEKLVYSLESTGINVAQLASTLFGIELDWGENGLESTVVAAGGVFAGFGAEEWDGRFPVVARLRQGDSASS